MGFIVALSYVYMIYFSYIPHLAPITLFKAPFPLPASRLLPPPAWVGLVGLGRGGDDLFLFCLLVFDIVDALGFGVFVLF